MCILSVGEELCGTCDFVVVLLVVFEVGQVVGLNVVYLGFVGREFSPLLRGDSVKIFPKPYTYICY